MFRLPHIKRYICLVSVFLFASGFSFSITKSAFAQNPTPFIFGSDSEGFFLKDKGGDIKFRIDQQGYLNAPFKYPSSGDNLVQNGTFEMKVDSSSSTIADAWFKSYKTDCVNCTYSRNSTAGNYKSGQYAASLAINASGGTASIASMDVAVEAGKDYKGSVDIKCSVSTSVVISVIYFTGAASATLYANSSGTPKTIFSGSCTTSWATKEAIFTVPSDCTGPNDCTRARMMIESSTASSTMYVDNAKITSPSSNTQLIAGNVGAGAFGANTGGGDYSFPANVGIGTTAPISTLDVRGGVTIGGDITNSAMRHFISWTSATPPGSSSTGSEISDNAVVVSTSQFGWHSSPSSLSPASPDYGGIDLGAGNAKVVKRVRFQVHGNPLKDFVLQGSNDSTTGLNGTWADLLSSTVTERTEYAWQSFDVSNSTAYRWYRVKATSQYATGWAMYKWELLETATAVGNNYISGALGVGTNVPKSMLDVNGAVSIGANYGGTSKAPLNGMIVEGNVGIGTTNPVGSLDVYSNGGHRLLTHSAHTFLTGPATGNVHIVNNAYWDGSSWYPYDAAQPQAAVWLGGGVINLLTGPASAIGWSSMGSRLYIANSGNVGIGTVSPNVKLEVAGSVRGNQAGALRIDTGNGYIDLGPMNASWAHLQTDRPNFYFNKAIYVDAGTPICKYGGGCMDPGWVNQSVTTGASPTFNNLYLNGVVPTIQGYSPSNYAIRMTPNFHLNAYNGYAVILNWDQGTTGDTATLRIGNGSSADAFQFSASGRMAINGNAITSGGSYGFGVGAAWPNKNSLAVDTLETDLGGTLELNYYNGGEVHIGSGGSKAIRAAIMYDGNDASYAVDPNGFSHFSRTMVGSISTWGQTDWGATVQIRRDGPGNIASANNSNSQLELETNWYGTPNIAFHRPGVFGANFGLDTDNWFSTQGWSAGGGYTSMRVGSFVANGSATITSTLTVNGGSSSNWGGLNVGGNIQNNSNIYSYGRICSQNASGNCDSSGGTVLNGGTVQSWGPHYANIYYDNENTGYYVDPNGTSRMNTFYYIDQAYIVDVRPQYMYDWNDSAYYIDMNNTSRFNYLGRNYGYNWTEYDWNDTTYYIDPNNTSIFNSVQANIFYDRQNTGYYVDPSGTTNLAGYLYVGQYLNIGLWTTDSPGVHACKRNYDNFMGLCTSLRKYKENIEDLTLGLDTVLALKPRTFDWKQPAGSTVKNHDLGFIAEEVERVNPLLAEYDQGKLISVKYDKLTALLTKAIQELVQKIDSLKEIVKTKVVETEKLIVGGVDVLKKLNELSDKSDKQQATINSQQKQIEEMKAEIESLKKQ